MARRWCRVHFLGSAISVPPAFGLVIGCGFIFRSKHKSLDCFLKVRPITKPLHLLELQLVSHFLANGLIALMEASSSFSPCFQGGTPQRTLFFTSDQVCLVLSSVSSAYRACLAHTKCSLNARTDRTHQNQNCPHNHCMEKSHILPRRAYNLDVFELSSSSFSLCSLRGCP